MIRIFGLLFILQIAGTQTELYSQPFPKNQVIDTVRCRNSASQSYALFLPAQFDAKKSWPVILIFDPSGRGRTGVSAFTEAGGKYGFILACSNNSRNGPMADNFTAAASMLQDINEKFSIDQKRIFAAGFSGGSRFALSLAVKDKRIAGVIGCGAGLPGDRNLHPSKNSTFLYFGLAGNRDMNYIEMHDLPEFFSSQTSVISYFRSFDGGHEWPLPALTTEAVEWLILQSMNGKIIEPDQFFISDIESKTENYINSQLSSGKAYDAAICMSFAVRDFRGTTFGNRMSQLMSATEKAEPYQKGLRKWNKMVANEQQRRDKYMNYIMEIVHSGSLPDSASIWWKHETNSLVGLRDKGSPENSQMSSRLLNFISILCYEQGIAYYRSMYYEQAAIFYEICTISDSENQNTYFSLARSLAAAGKAKESLDALAAAVKHGFTSRKTIESEPVFGFLRNEDRYKDLMSKLK
jgi:pimeloyl-ACP methyl ester carboxylesterase